MYPKKLEKGDQIRVVAPSRSMSIISKEVREIANQRFSDLGLNLTFGEHVEESDKFNSSSIESRISDIHEAFSDNDVDGIITVIGGFNSNQLLDYIDWEIIRENPKPFCGYSDATILNNAILEKAGLVTYYGPHYSTFGQKYHLGYTLDYFKKCLMNDEPFEIKESENWTDDKWYENQEERSLIKNEGWTEIKKGRAEGTVIGGNMGTFSLLQGTDYFPKMKDFILFVEDDDLAGESSAVEFDRYLQSVLQQNNLKNILGVVIGRFPKASKMTNEKIRKIINSKKSLKDLPVIAGVDFAHTDPQITFPIGGKVKITAGNSPKIKFLKH
ncbi:MAG: S66 peptidase family protein [Candidatus Paceibacterota bacterium]